MKTPVQVVSLLAALFASCASGTHRTVVFSFANKSEHRLNWVSLEEARINPIGGALSPGVFKTTVDQVWRNDVRARVTFIDFETRSPHSIPISFAEVDKHIQAGQCRHVIITILDYHKATVRCE